MNISKREMRDLYLLAGIVFTGVILMFIAGQFAVRVLPRWNVPSSMESNIDPNDNLPSAKVAAGQGFAPLRPEILTPQVWQRSFLTPLAEELGPLNEIPVVIVAPSTSLPASQPTKTDKETQEAPTLAATPSASAVVTPTPFPTNTLVFVFPTWTFTPKPPAATFTNTFTPTATFTATSTSTATATSTATGTATATATNTATATATFVSPTPTASETASQTASPTLTSTPITPIAPPTNINIGNPDRTVYNLGKGGSVTFTLDPPISSGASYDFVFYERWLSDNGDGVPGIQMDRVIVEISPDNVTWYTVLYWGDASNDFNTNLNGLSPESDNYRIAKTSLYNNSGILIDIDSLGLTGSYPFIKFTDPGTGDGADIDAIQLLH